MDVRWLHKHILQKDDPLQFGSTTMKGRTEGRRHVFRKNYNIRVSESMGNARMGIVASLRTLRGLFYWLPDS